MPYLAMLKKSLKIPSFVFIYCGMDSDVISYK